MNKSDLKEIKDVIDDALEAQLAKFHKKIDSTMERHLGSVHEEITDLRSDIDTQFAKVETKFTAVEGKMDRLGAKIDHIDEKLGGFENREVDKRLQLEVRVGRLEKQRS